MNAEMKREKGAPLAPNVHKCRYKYISLGSVVLQRIHQGLVERPVPDALSA